MAAVGVCRAFLQRSKLLNYYFSSFVWYCCYFHYCTTDISLPVLVHRSLCLFCTSSPRCRQLVCRLFCFTLKFIKCDCVRFSLGTQFTFNLVRLCVSPRHIIRFSYLSYFFRFRFFSCVIEYSVESSHIYIDVWRVKVYLLPNRITLISCCSAFVLRGFISFWFVVARLFVVHSIRNKKNCFHHTTKVFRVFAQLFTRNRQNKNKLFALPRNWNLSY